MTNPMTTHESAARPTPLSQSEWAARVELAAVYRLIDHWGWDEFIYNHSAARVPDEPHMFLIKRHEHLYSEVTASNLVKVAIGGEFDPASAVNKPGFILHSGVFAARPDVNVSIHVHTMHGGAVAALSTGLKMISQPALRFFGRIGYHAFEGIVDSATEQYQIARDLAHHRALILRNHGLLVVGQHCAQTLGSLRHLMTACQLQLLAQATGQSLIEVPPDVCEATARQIEAVEKSSGNKDMAAYLRLAAMLDARFST